MRLEELAWLRLHLTPGLGRRRLWRLAQTFGTGEAILDAGEDGWRERAGIIGARTMRVPPSDSPGVTEALAALEKSAARLLPCTDVLYPPLLKEIPDPPPLLYVRGDLPKAEAFAVVGARRSSETGRRLTCEISAELASREIVIVSGLARGIDTAAHQGAVEAGGCSVGVLGCGIDLIYPPENRGLFSRLLERGAILSEYPPGTLPLAGHFPGRNRIISGLCRGVLVVEAAAGSGSLITADFALEQGREVFAVPGAIGSPVSSGVNHLLKQGAHLVTGPEDILEVLWPGAKPSQTRRQEEAFASTLDRTARLLFDCLGVEPLHIDQLARKTGLTPMEVSAILLHLELQGGVESRPGQRYLRRRPT